MVQGHGPAPVFNKTNVFKCLNERNNYTLLIVVDWADCSGPDTQRKGAELGRSQIDFRPVDVATAPIQIQAVALNAHDPVTFEAHQVGELMYQLQSKPHPRGWTEPARQLNCLTCPCCKWGPEGPAPGSIWRPDEPVDLEDPENPHIPEVGRNLRRTSVAG